MYIFTCSAVRFSFSKNQKEEPAINTAFLDADLLDEVIVLIGAGIDGRASFTPVFNRDDNGKKEPTLLELVDVKKYDSGAVFIRYKTK